MVILQNEQHSPATEDTVSSEKCQCQETSAVLLSEDEGELPSDEYSNNGNNEITNTGHARSYTPSDSQIQGDWYPFTSKIEMLCYIFMSSASHHVGTYQNGITFWILKPKELLKLFISNPKVSSQIVRHQIVKQM